MSKDFYRNEGLVVTDRLRIGVLGAARVVKNTLVIPAWDVPEVAVTAIAARSVDRARRAAEKLGIPKVHSSYEALLADSEIDAVYIPLPVSLHAPWSMRAMESGKHVLCEKPITSNEQEARMLAAVASREGRVICEAMHPVYHKLFDRVGEIVAAGTLGDVRHVAVRLGCLWPRKTGNRWQYELAGGALLDVGVYALTMLRAFAGMDPVEITSVAAKVRIPNVDRLVDVQFRFPGGATGSIWASMWGWPPYVFTSRIEGSLGTLTVSNPLLPQRGNKIELDIAGKKSRERVQKLPSSYTGELRAFAGAVLRGEPLRTGPDHFVPNMRLIDAIYRRAGLPLRGPRLADVPNA